MSLRGDNLHRGRSLVVALATVCFTTSAWAQATAGTQGEAHGDPVASVILSLAIILVAAKIGGHLAARINQPPVLGELLAGVLVGNLSLVGYHGFELLGADPSIDMLSRIGVILLLFT